MASFFSKADYAEDQRYAHEILYLHTIRSGAMLGTVIPFITAPTALLVSRFRSKTTPKPTFSLSTLVPRLITHSGRGIVIGSIFGAVATWGRMRERDEIEWQDRSWRLITNNKGQEELDIWGMGGGLLGAAGAFVAARRGTVLLRNLGTGTTILGGAGVGMGTASLVCLAYRNGIKGGKFKE